MPTKTTKKFRVTPVPVELRAEVREGLRKSRDLMNDEGDHWTQGDYKREHPMKHGQFQWCAVGGIRELLHQAEVEAYAIVVLAERGIVDSPHEHRAKRLQRWYEERLEEQRQEWEWEKRNHYQALIPKPTSLSIEDKASICEDVVTGWNDDPRREWDEVRAAFTRAAASVRGGAQS